jgi:hypothetical protein
MFLKILLLISFWACLNEQLPNISDAIVKKLLLFLLYLSL